MKSPCCNDSVLWSFDGKDIFHCKKCEKDITKEIDEIRDEVLKS